MVGLPTRGFRKGVGINDKQRRQRSGIIELRALTSRIPGLEQKVLYSLTFMILHFFTPKQENKYGFAITLKWDFLPLSTSAR